MILVVQQLFFYDRARKERGGRGKTMESVKQYCEQYLQQTLETPMSKTLRWRLLLFQFEGQRWRACIFLRQERTNADVRRH